MKECRECHQLKALGEFYKNKRMADGLYKCCKVCFKKYVRNWQKENSIRVQEIQRLYRNAHPERLIKTRERVQAWTSRNIERKLENNNHRRVIKLGASGSHTSQEWEDKKYEFGGKCAYCGIVAKMTKDHIVPLSRGGSDYISNIVPSCKSCNCKKHNTPLDEFLKRISAS